MYLLKRQSRNFPCFSEVQCSLAYSKHLYINRIYIYVHIHTYIYIHTHTQRHTHTHTHTHTPRSIRLHERSGQLVQRPLPTQHITTHKILTAVAWAGFEPVLNDTAIGRLLQSYGLEFCVETSFTVARTIPVSGHLTKGNFDRLRTTKLKTSSDFSDGKWLLFVPDRELGTKGQIGNCY